MAQGLLAQHRQFRPWRHLANFAQVCSTVVNETETIAPQEALVNKAIWPEVDKQVDGWEKQFAKQKIGNSRTSDVWIGGFLAESWGLLVYGASQLLKIDLTVKKN